MRIWDVAPGRLCRGHLLGEHRELHAIWSILTRRRKGYRRHPEVLRWRGKLKALFRRHKELVAEMLKRGYVHRSPLGREPATGSARQGVLITPYREQLMILKRKGCGCIVAGRYR